LVSCALLVTLSIISVGTELTTSPLTLVNDSSLQDTVGLTASTGPA